MFAVPTHSHVATWASIHTFVPQLVIRGRTAATIGGRGTDQARRWAEGAVGGVGDVGVGGTGWQALMGGNIVVVSRSALETVEGCGGVSRRLAAEAVCGAFLTFLHYSSCEQIIGLGTLLNASAINQGPSAITAGTVANHKTTGKTALFARLTSLTGSIVKIASKTIFTPTGGSIYVKGCHTLLARTGSPGALYAEGISAGQTLECEGVCVGGAGALSDTGAGGHVGAVGTVCAGVYQAAALQAVLGTSLAAVLDRVVRGRAIAHALAHIQNIA